MLEGDEDEDEIFHAYRGSSVEERALPWADIEKWHFIAVSKYPGDDVAIALDYRTSPARVIGTSWSTKENHWKLIAKDIDVFVDMLNLRCEK